MVGNPAEILMARQAIKPCRTPQVAGATKDGDGKHAAQGMVGTPGPDEISCIAGSQRPDRIARKMENC